MPSTATSHRGGEGRPDGARVLARKWDPQRPHRGPAAITYVASVWGASSQSVASAAGRSGSPYLSHRKRVWQYRWASAATLPRTAEFDAGTDEDTHERHDLGDVLDRHLGAGRAQLLHQLLKGGQEAVVVAELL
ncbi:hypothetical protein SALBM311S_05679 [Streptomyces alboniger]